MGRYAMLFAFAALVVGVLITHCFIVPLWLYGTFFIVVLIGAIITSYESLTLLALVGMGALISTVEQTRSVEESYDGEYLGYSINERLHSGALDRLYLLDISYEAFALSQAITLGERRDMSSSVKECYSESGVQHLLAISGLHISIVIFIATLLTAPLVLFTHGHIWRWVIVVVLLWLFVLSTTMPVSVLRAALMLSLLMLTRVLGSRYNSINSLALAAFILTILDCEVIFNLGFQLSFIAVGAILLFMPLFAELIRGIRRFHLLYLLLEMFAVGFVATLAITPIVSYTFGTVSPLSPIVTIMVTPLLFITIPATLLWIIAPLPLIKPLVEWLLERSSSLQIYITSMASDWHLSQIDYTMSGWSVGLFYLVLFVLSPLIVERNQKK